MRRLLSNLDKVVHTDSEGDTYTVRDLLRVAIIAVAFMIVWGLLGFIDCH